MNTSFSASVALLAATLFVPSWAQGPADDTSARPRQAATPMTHLAVGTVRSVDAAGRSVVIDHQAIPTLDMPAMAMAFHVPASSAPPLTAGQSIAFTFTASTEGLTIGSVQVVDPAAGFTAGRSQPGHTMSGMRQHGMKGMGDMKAMKDSCHEMMGGR